MTGIGNSAVANAATATNLSNQNSSNAANVYGGLEPQLAAEAAHPTGLTPIQKATQNTAAQQSAGGGNAGAIGAGKLYSARTNNAGGAKAAIGQATRGTGANLSSAALGTEQQDASLQNKNRQAGLNGLQGLNSTETNAADSELGLSNQALKVASTAPVPWWEGALNRSVQGPFGIGVGQIEGTGGASG